MIFEHSEYLVFAPADIALKPRRKHLAYAVMVAYRGARLLNGVEDSGVVSLEFVGIAHLGDEDEIEVGALRVAVRHMSGDYRVGQGVADLAHITVDLRHV